MFSTRFEGTQLGGITPGAGDDVKIVFHKHFSSHDDKTKEPQCESESSVGLRRFPPAVVSVLPHTINYSLSEDENFDYDDLSGVDEFMMCLDLMESPLFEDNRYGIGRLMKLVNAELVNSKTSGSIALDLVSGDSGDRPTERFRAVFLQYLCNTSGCRKETIEGLILSSDSDSTSSSFESASFQSNFRDSVVCLGGLKLPAVRILASSLELWSSQCQDDDRPKLDLSSHFWTMALGSITEMTEDFTLRRVQATLSIKCIRLLHSLEPSTIGPFVRYSLMPFVEQAHEMGVSVGDLGLARESKMLLDAVQ